MSAEQTIVSNQSPKSVNAIGEQVSGFFKWAPLIIMSLALAIIIIDTTVLNVSLRNIITDLHTDIHKIQWVITAYSLILAAFTITGGRLGDLFGRKKVFVIGAVIFAIGSIVTALSTSVTMILIGNAVIEGIGACLMMPATAALLLSNYQGRDRALAFGVWGGIVAASAAVGPVLGGWLTTHWSWRWAFGINPIVVILLLVGSIIIKEARDTEHKPTIDYVGVILSSLGLLSIAFGFVQASEFGWFKAKDQLLLLGHRLDLGNLSVTPLFVILGILILVAFAFWENYITKKGRMPLVNLDLFKNKEFIIGASVTAILAIGQTGIFFSIPVFLQAVRNLNPLQTGLAMLPMPALILVAAPLSAKLSHYISPKRLIQIGLIIDVIGLLVLRSELTVAGNSWGLAPGFALFGFGMGLIFAQVSNVTLSAVSVQEAGEAAGVNNTMRQVGATLGAAIMGAILISTLSSNLVTGIKDSKFIPDAAKPSITEVVSKQSSEIEFGSSSQVGNGKIPQRILDEIKNISYQATSDASKSVAIYAGIFLILGLLVSIFLPNKKELHGAEEGVQATTHATETTEHVPDALPVAAMDVVEASQVVSAKQSPKLSHLQAGLIVGGATLIIGALGGYLLGLYNNNNSNSNTVQTVQVVEPTNNIQPTNSNDNSSAQTNSSDQSLMTSPTENPQSEENNPTPVLQTYSNSAMKFKIEIPTDWSVEPSATQVIIKTPEGARFSIQTYTAENADPESFKQFLVSQPNMHNVIDASIAGHQAFSFDLDGFYKHGYAFLVGDKIYYLLGENIENTAIAQSFQTTN